MPCYPNKFLGQYHQCCYLSIENIFSLLASEPKLLVITEQRSVGFLPGGHEVFKIEKIVCIALSVDSEQDIELKVCSFF